MKRAYLRYYEHYSPVANLHFLWNAWRTRSLAARLALLNRQRDYRRLAGNPRLLALHHALNRHLLASAQEWDSYDFAEGYFYQGLRRIGVTGLRDTEARIESMSLRDRIAGCSVLEIGCNCGFLSMAVADVVGHVVGFDVNPHVIRVARRVADYLGYTNTSFHCTPFEEFRPAERFDVVLSLAAHATYDGNTRQSNEAYLARCRQLLEPGGVLLFESHPPGNEDTEALAAVCSIIDRLFDIREQRVLEHGTYLDRGRTFIAAQCPVSSGDLGHRARGARWSCGTGSVTGSPSPATTC